MIMKTKLLKLYSGILSSLLVFLGFTACSSDDDGSGPMVEYGTPSAMYKVKGTVVSSDENKEAIKGIRAVMILTNDGKEYHSGDTIFTDNEGKFDLKLIEFPMQKVTFNLKLDDVDGEANGSFESKIQAVEFDDSELTGGKGWFIGEVEKDMGKIELKPSQKDEE